MLIAQDVVVQGLIPTDRTTWMEVVEVRQAGRSSYVTVVIACERYLCTSTPAMLHGNEAYDGEDPGGRFSIVGAVAEIRVGAQAKASCS